MGLELIVINALIGALAVFFVIGAGVNVIAPSSIRADYHRWNYPPWFNYVTFFIELAVAALLLISKTTIFGIALGGMTMMAALITVLVHREYRRAIAPSVVLGFITLLFILY